MLNNSKLNNRVVDNFKNIKLWVLLPSTLLLFLIYIYFFLYNDGDDFVEVYVKIQQDLFFYLNNKLSAFPNVMFNITQFGDVIISYSLLTVFIIYAPKLWEALLTSAILSLIISAVLKKIFAVPRPAAMFDHTSFRIIGETISGKSSLPSGHSIVTFITITTLLIAFLPRKNSYKIIWCLFLLSLGLLIAFSRVGVGAHYPLDVIIGSTIGFIIAILGIKISNGVNWFTWIENKKLYPIYILVLSVWGFFIVKKITDINLLIFYISLLSLLITLYLMTTTYVQKNK